MPALIPPSTPQAAEVRPLWDVEETAVSQGREGRQVREQLQDVTQHWRQQSLAAPVFDAGELADLPSEYRHPPFAKIGTVRVRFTGITVLKPRPFVVEEDDS
jgi:hypothetical protein